MAKVEKRAVALLLWWAVEDFPTPGTLDLKKSYHHSGPSPMRPNELWTRPDDEGTSAQAPGCQRSSCRSVEEEEEGTSVASDVVKVEGEDPVTVEVSGHPRLSKGGQGEEGCRRFSIVGASPLARS